MSTPEERQHQEDNILQERPKVVESSSHGSNEYIVLATNDEYNAKFKELLELSDDAFNHLLHDKEAMFAFLRPLKKDVPRTLMSIALTFRANGLEFPTTKHSYTNPEIKWKWTEVMQKFCINFLNQAPIKYQDKFSKWYDDILKKLEKLGLIKIYGSDIASGKQLFKVNPEVDETDWGHILLTLHQKMFTGTSETEKKYPNLALEVGNCTTITAFLNTVEREFGRTSHGISRMIELVRNEILDPLIEKSFIHPVDDMLQISADVFKLPGATLANILRCIFLCESDDSFRVQFKNLQLLDTTDMSDLFMSKRNMDKFITKATEASTSAERVHKLKVQPTSAEDPVKLNKNAPSTASGESHPEMNSSATICSFCRYIKNRGSRSIPKSSKLFARVQIKHPAAKCKYVNQIIDSIVNKSSINQIVADVPKSDAQSSSDISNLYDEDDD